MGKYLLFALLGLRLAAQPVITSQPANQPVVWGGNAAFSVMATGVGPFTYQWQMNGTNLPNNLITTVAGGQLFDGLPGTNTILNSPQCAAVDTVGNLFIADTYNHVIRKLGTNGVTTIVAGNGSAGFAGDGGASTNANLWGPLAVVVDTNDNLFISDSGNNRIRKVDTNGVITTFAGNGLPPMFPTQVGDYGAATNANIFYPVGLCLDGAGNLFIADSQDNRVREVGTNGLISTVAGTGTAGTGGGENILANLANLNYPTGVALDSANNLYIVDSSNNRVRKVYGSYQWTIVNGNQYVIGKIVTVAGTGTAGYFGDGGSATSAKLSSPNGISADTVGNIFVSDAGNHCIRKITNGVISTLAGTGAAGFSGDGGTALGAALNFPASVIPDGKGSLFIADGGNNRIRKLDASGVINTAVGTNLNDGSLAINGTFSSPNGLTRDSLGNFYVSDTANIRIRKIDINGIITTYAGNGIFGFAGDAGAATNASLKMPNGIAADASGNLYIADRGNLRVRKVDTNGTITTVAGSGSLSPLGDGGAATSAGIQPFGVAVDGVGNLFIADNIHVRIRKVDTNGIMTTFAGTGSFGYSGDGGAATSAKLAAPTSVCVDGSGNVLIGEWGAVRKVDTNGTITTIAGKGYTTTGFSGDGGFATNALLSSSIWGVWSDPSGNVFISDAGNARVRKVNTNGIISTIAGSGSTGFSGDGGSANNAQMTMPAGLAGDQAGNLYMVCNGNNRIRKLAYVDYADQPSFTVTKVTPVAGSNNFSVIITGASGSVTSSVVSVNLQLPPLVPAFTATNGALSFTWSAVSNRTYQLQCATNLVAPVWQNLGSPVTATNGTVSLSDLPGPDAPRFYRVELVP